MEAAGVPLPPDEESPTTAFFMQLITEQRNEMLRLGSAVDSLTQAVSALSVAAPPPSSPVVPSTFPTAPFRAEAPIQLPERYNGNIRGCRGFLLQCSLYFNMHPGLSDSVRVGTIVSRLTGKALEWATAVVDAAGWLNFSYMEFMTQFRAVFDHPPEGKEAGEKLLRLRQGTQSAADYAMTFRTLAAASGWNDSALLTVYRQGLRPDLQAELACRDESLSLSALISMSIRLDHLLRERRRSVAGNSVPPSATEDDEHMDVTHARLSPAERRARLQSGACLYCGETDHQLATCPTKPPEGTRRRYTPTRAGPTVGGDMPCTPQTHSSDGTRWLPPWRGFRQDPYKPHRTGVL